MALSSSSTDAEVIAQYEDNALFESSSTKAQNFLEAVRILIRRFPQSQTIQSRGFTMTSLESMERRAAEVYKNISLTSNRSNWTSGRPRY
jgi:hypothetical protein